MKYTAEEKFTTEEGAAADLATREYNEAWENAKAEVELSARAVPDCTIGQYWDEVRLCFLELGGTWKGEPRPFHAKQGAYYHVLTWARQRQKEARDKPEQWKIWSEVIQFTSRELAAFEEEEADTHL